MIVSTLAVDGLSGARVVVVSVGCVNVDLESVDAPKPREDETESVDAPNPPNPPVGCVTVDFHSVDAPNPPNIVSGGEETGGAVTREEVAEFTTLTGGTTVGTVETSGGVAEGTGTRGGTVLSTVDPPVLGRMDDGTADDSFAPPARLPPPSPFPTTAPAMSRFSGGLDSTAALMPDLISVRVAERMEEEAGAAIVETRGRMKE